MGLKMSRFSLVVVLAGVLLCPEAGMSLVGIGGRRPIKGDHGWPVGSLAMANLKTRFRWLAGPGSTYRFHYRCRTTAEFNQALETFAAIRAGKLELIVHNGPKYGNQDGRRPEDRIDWTFTVWNPKVWDQIRNRPRGRLHLDRKPVPAPTVDVYVGGGAIAWSEVAVPVHLLVTDKRPASVSKEFAGKGLVRAKVYDLATGRPIPAAQISLAKYARSQNRAQPIRALTDADGSCQIAGIPLGLYTITVAKEGYVTRKVGRRHGISYDNRRAEYFQFAVGLSRPACMKGTVTDLDGNPIKGIRVSARDIIGIDGCEYACVGDRSATTDKHGRFEIRDLPVGFAAVRCRTQSWHLAKSPFDMYRTTSTSVTLGLEGTGTIRGKVVDGHGKAPAGEVIVEIDPPGGPKVGTWGGAGRMRKDGTFEFRGVPPGDYVLSAKPNPWRSDQKPKTTRVSVKSGKTYELTLPLAGVE